MEAPGQQGSGVGEEDLARSLLVMITMNIGQVCVTCVCMWLCVAECECFFFFFVAWRGLAACGTNAHRKRGWCKCRGRICGRLLGRLGSLLCNGITHGKNSPCLCWIRWANRVSSTGTGRRTVVVNCCDGNMQTKKQLACRILECSHMCWQVGVRPALEVCNIAAAYHLDLEGWAWLQRLRASCGAFVWWAVRRVHQE